MQCILLASPNNPPKEDKLTNSVAKCNLKTYNGSYDPIELEEWIRSMEKIFKVIRAPEENKVTISTFYFIEEVDIQWNIVKDESISPEFTWNKLLGELRAKFYPTMVQQ